MPALALATLPHRAPNFLRMKPRLGVFAVWLAIASLRADWTATAPGRQPALTVSLDPSGTPHYRVTHGSTRIHDAVRKAADHHLLVDIHDSYRPSGFTCSPADPADVTLCV